jgi:DNA polymerase III gamma/tau subunit
VAMNDPLITKYRPINFEEVIGHESVVNAIKKALASDSRPHAFLMTGPSGTGKTTLARIIGAELGAEITEIDAASNNGIEDVRELIEFAQHLAFTKSGLRLFIIDECHGLSKAAWNALLKLLEDPPDHLFLALCTTEPQKVMDTVLNRCYPVMLKALPNSEIEDLLGMICELEGWKVHPDVFDMVVHASTGQPRKALSIMQAVHDAPDREEAARIVRLVELSNPMSELLQHLTSGKRSWKIIRGLIQKMDTDSFEDALIPCGRYISAALLNTDDDGQAQMLWQMLEALVFPAATFDKRVMFIAAIGRVLWGG